VPSDTGAPSTVICNGPSTPNPILFWVIAPIVTRVRQEVV
jgi:hypothetical protein